MSTLSNVQMTSNLKKCQMCWITACQAGIKGPTKHAQRGTHELEVAKTAPVSFSSFI